MQQWKECKLGDIAAVQTGPFGSQLHAADYVSDGTPCIMPTNIGSWLEIDLHEIACVKDEDLERLNRYQVQTGDIVYSRRGDVEKCAYINEGQSGWLCGTGCLRVRINSEDVNPKFIAYYLSTGDSKAYILNSAVGTTMLNLNSSLLNGVPIRLPPRRLQDTIESTFTSLDDKIDLLQRQNKTLEALAETLFRQWFIEEADKNWEWVIVKDVAHANELSITSTKAFSEINYLDTGSITDGNIEAWQTLNMSEAPSRARRIIRSDDIVVSTVRPIQRHYGLLKNPPANAIASTGFCVLTCHSIDPHFLYLLLTQDDVTETFESIAEGSTTTYPSLRPADIENFKFQLPTAGDLQRFADFANPTWSKIEENKKQIQTLTKLRDTLLPKLMSGEITIS